MKKGFIKKDATEQKTLDAGQLPWRTEDKKMAQRVQVTVEVLALVFTIKMTHSFKGAIRNLD